MEATLETVSGVVFLETDGTKRDKLRVVEDSKNQLKKIYLSKHYIAQIGGLFSAPKKLTKSASLKRKKRSRWKSTANPMK
jgi:hypothetical protein